MCLGYLDVDAFEGNKTMASHWFYRYGNRDIGPISASQLRSLAKAGKIGPGTPIRKSDDSKWMKAARVKGLFDGIETAQRVADPDGPDWAAIADVISEASAAEDELEDEDAEPAVELAVVRDGVGSVSVEAACGNCGGRMLVEKPGAMVVCPHCRVTVIVPGTPPTAAPSPSVDSPPVDSSPEDAHWRSFTASDQPKTSPNQTNAVVAGFVVLVGGISIFLCCGGLSNSNSHSTPSTGETGVLRSGAGVMVAVSEKVLDRVTSLSVAKDAIGLGQLVAEERVCIVEDGTECLVIDLGILKTEVRILSGPYAGQSGFIATDFLHK